MAAFEDVNGVPPYVERRSAPMVGVRTRPGSKSRSRVALTRGSSVRFTAPPQQFACVIRVNTVSGALVV